VNPTATPMLPTSAFLSAEPGADRPQSLSNSAHAKARSHAPAMPGCRQAFREATRPKVRSG